MPVSRFDRILDWTLALGVLFALETQFRSETSVAGPGEILLASWIGGMLCRNFIRSEWIVTSAAIEIGAFWAIFAFALCLGSMQTIASGTLIDFSLGFHDIVADSLVALICLLLTLGPAAAQRVRRIQWAIAISGSVLLALQLANAAGLFVISDIDPWFWDRMRGWTSNPNQFALLCLLLAFLSLHLADVESSSLSRRAVAIFFCALAVVGGWFGKSNAYVLVIVGGIGFFLMAKASRWLLRLERREIPALSFSAAVGALAVYVALVTLPLIGANADLMRDAGGLARDSRNELEDSSVRIELWKQALQRGADSWLLGMGPGPHLEIPNIVLLGRRSGNEPVNMSHPTAGLAPNFEAHNTLLELFVQGGLVSVSAYLWIVGLALWRAWRVGADGMVATLLAVNAFGSFHVVFRHPFVWFLVCGALVGARSAQPENVLRRTAGPYLTSVLRARMEA
jgi:O-antigen ligase